MKLHPLFLNVMRRPVQSVLRQQFFMRTPLNHLSLIQDDDLIGMFQCTDPVGNDDRSLPSADIPNRLHDFRLRHRVDGAYAVIQNEDRCILDYSPCKAGRAAVLRTA